MTETERTAWLNERQTKSLHLAGLIVLLLQEHGELAANGFLKSRPATPNLLVPHPGLAGIDIFSERNPNAEL